MSKAIVIGLSRPEKNDLSTERINMKKGNGSKLHFKNIQIS